MQLNGRQSNGADELVPGFLNLTKQELAYPLIILLQNIMVSELSESFGLPTDWKLAKCSAGL